MITTAPVVVEGDGAARILSTVEALFSSNRRFFNWYRLEPPDQGWGCSVRGYFLTGGGETIEVRVKSESVISTELEIKGKSYPLFDWGSTERHVLQVVQSLRDGNMPVEMHSLEKDHSLGGPFRIFGG